MTPPCSGPPKVSVLVLNHNGAHLLPDCLTSLRQQEWTDLEVIVVDNASTDASRAVAEAHGAVFLKLDGNYGYAQANNRAAREASGDYIFFLNNDTWVEAGAIRRLMEVMLADDRVGVADCGVLDWEGRRVIHHALRLERSTFFRSTFPNMNVVAAPGDRVEVIWGCGSSLLVRRAAFESLGGFDETFFFDWDDADLCWRGWMLGWKVVHVAAARIRHKVGETFRATNAERRSQWAALRAVEGTKNYLRFTVKVMPPLVVAKVLMRELFRIPRQALFGHPGIGLAQLRALGTLSRSLPDVLRVRRRIALEAVIDSRNIIARFSAPG